MKSFITSSEIIEKDNELMKQACDLATENIRNGNGPFGCIITDFDGNIISTGVNRVTLDNDPTLHAEIVAIKNACKIKNYI